MNVAHLFARNAARAGELPAVARGGAPRLTHRELVERAARLAGALRGACGLRPGDRVALAMANTPEYVEALLACWWAGLAAVPVNAKLHASEIAWILGHAEAKVCFATEDLASHIAGPERIVPVAGREYRSLLSAEHLAMAEVPRTRPLGCSTPAAPPAGRRVP
jgi:long-chain acyl-CoA synthetase